MRPIGCPLASRDQGSKRAAGIVSLSLDVGNETDALLAAGVRPALQEVLSWLPRVDKCVNWGLLDCFLFRDASTDRTSVLAVCGPSRRIEVGQSASTLPG